MSAATETLKPVPHNLPLRDLSPTGQLDDQLLDGTNFNLDDDIAAALSSLLTAVAIMLLADVVFRVVVRADRVNVSSHAIYRNHMLSRVSNPLIWPSALSSPLYRRPETASHACASDVGAPQPGAPPQPGVLPQSVPYGTLDPEEEKHVSANGAPPALDTREANVPRISVPLYVRLLVVLSGLMLVAAELVIIFFASSVNMKWTLDGNEMPAFRLQSPDSDFAYRFPSSLEQQWKCKDWPVTERKAFMTVHPINICSKIFFFNSEDDKDDRIPPEMIFLDVTLRNFSIVFDLIFADLRVHFEQDVEVGADTGMIYRVIPDVDGQAIRDVFPSFLKRRGFSVEMFETRYNKDERMQPDLTVPIDLNITGLTLGDAELQRGRESLEFWKLDAGGTSLQSVAWALYLGDAMRSTLSVSGRSRAYNKEDIDENYAAEPLWDFEFLPAKPAQLVYQRPRLSLLASIVFCSIIFALWCVVSCGLRWRAGVDHRQAWFRLFEGMDSPADLSTREEQILDTSSMKGQPISLK